MTPDHRATLARVRAMAVQAMLDVSAPGSTEQLTTGPLNTTERSRLAGCDPHLVAAIERTLLTLHRLAPTAAAAAARFAAQRQARGRSVGA